MVFCCFYSVVSTKRDVIQKLKVIVNNMINKDEKTKTY